MTAINFEERLTMLERELAKLKAQSAPKAPVNQHPVQTLEATHGTFQDDEALKEATRVGRKWRASLDRKPRGKQKAKRK